LDIVEGKNLGKLSGAKNLLNDQWWIVLDQVGQWYGCVFGFDWPGAEL